MTKIKTVLMGLFILLGVYLTMNLLTINSGFGEKYTYEMSKNESDEFFVSQMCISGVEMNVTNIPQCDILVGSIDTNYGEKIK